MEYCIDDCVVSHFSHVQLCATLRTIAHPAPLSKGFFQQEYWRGLPRLPPGDLPDPGSKPCLSRLLHWQASSLPTSTTWDPVYDIYVIYKINTIIILHHILKYVLHI